MQKYLFIFLILYSAISLSEESNDNNDMIIGLLVTAKAAGMCGVFSQMANFQETTKMPGGDEFIVRFFSTEAARLGHTLESFMQQCPVVVSRYVETMELFGFQQ